MITGKYLENPALYSPDELERLDNHIEKYFGKATTVVHEFFSEDIHVDVSIIPPHEEHNYYTLVTTGMGAFSMKIPSEYQEDGLPSRIELMMCALPGFVDSKNEEKTERNAGYLVVSHSGGGMLRQGTRKGIRRTPANRGMRAHWVVKGLDISEDVCHGMCP